MIRLALCVAFDLFDLTFGRVVVAGTAFEGLGAAILFLLWGPIGLTYLWEVIDITDQIDGFVPTATLIALYVGWRKGLLVERAPQ